MPANIPFLPAAIADFIQRINSSRVTDAETAMCGESRQLTGWISPILGVPDQPLDVMRISRGLANFLTLQTGLLAAQNPHLPLKAIDIGTFTGSSAAAIAKGMRYGGRVISCDIDTEKTKEFHGIARRYWRAEGLAERIELNLGPAEHTLTQLVEQAQKATFDLAFIDADKVKYDLYYEKTLSLIRPGGLIIFDNMLWSGRVADAGAIDAETQALRALNYKIAADHRVTHVLLGDDDGVMMVMKPS